MPGRRSPRRPPEVARGEHAKKAFKGGLGGASYLPAPIRDPSPPPNDEHDEVLFWQDLYQGNGVRNSFPLTYLPIQNSERVYLQAANSTQSKYCREGPSAVWVKTHTKVEGASGTDNVTFHQAPPEGTMVVVDYAYRPTAPPCADTGPPGSPYLLRLSEDIHDDPRWPYWEQRYTDEYGTWWDHSWIVESMMGPGLITLDHDARIVMTTTSSGIYDDWDGVYLDGPNIRTHVVQYGADGDPELLSLTSTPVPLYPNVAYEMSYYDLMPFYDDVRLVKVPGERSVIAFALQYVYAWGDPVIDEHRPVFICDYYEDLSGATSGSLSEYREARVVIRYDFSADYRSTSVRWVKVVGHYDDAWHTTRAAMGGWSGGNTVVDGVINMVTTTDDGLAGSWTKIRASDGALLSRTYHPFPLGRGDYLMMNDGVHVAYGRPATTGVYQYIFDTSTGSTGFTTTSLQDYYGPWQSYTDMSGVSADGTMCPIDGSGFVVLGYNNVQEVAPDYNHALQMAHTFSYGGPGVGFYPTGSIILGLEGAPGITYEGFGYRIHDYYKESQYRCWRNFGWFYSDDHHSNRTTLLADGVLHIGTCSETFDWSRYPPVEHHHGWGSYDDLGPMLVRVPSGIPSGSARNVEVEVSHLPRRVVRSEGLCGQLGRNAITRVKGGVVMVFHGTHGTGWGLGVGEVDDPNDFVAPPYRTFDFLMRPYMLFFPDA